MDMVRLRYIGVLPVMVAALGRQIEPDSVAAFPGRVLDAAEGSDCLLIESGNPATVRAWPLSLWVDETPVSRKKKE